MSEDNIPTIKLIMGRHPSDKDNKIYLNGEDITRYVRNINIDAGADRFTTATIVLSIRAVVEAPAILMAYIREEDKIHEDDLVDPDSLT